MVSSVKAESEPFTFSVQVLDSSAVASLEKLMSDLSLHNRNQANASPAGFSPRSGDLISAKSDADNTWYRARVKKASGIKKEASVVFIDYGNEETLPFARLRPLDAKFKSLPGQARDARLSFVKVPPKGSEYRGDALRCFEDLAAGKRLVANVDQREGNLLHLRLIDPTDPAAAEDPLVCLNADMCREGVAILDSKLRYLAAYPQVVKKMNQGEWGIAGGMEGRLTLQRSTAPSRSVLTFTATVASRRTMRRGGGGRSRAALRWDSSNNIREPGITMYRI